MSTEHVPPIPWAAFVEAPPSPWSLPLFTREPTENARQRLTEHRSTYMTIAVHVRMYGRSVRRAIYGFRYERHLFPGRAEGSRK
jgi:hypothetical protein